MRSNSQARGRYLYHTTCGRRALKRSLIDKIGCTVADEKIEYIEDLSISRISKALRSGKLTCAKAGCASHLVVIVLLQPLK